MNVTTCTAKRSVSALRVPPPCEKMKLMSLQRAEVPEKIRLAMVRVVSVPYSMITGGTPLARLRQQDGLFGWV